MTKNTISTAVRIAISKYLHGFCHSFGDLVPRCSILSIVIILEDNLVEHTQSRFLPLIRLVLSGMQDVLRHRVATSLQNISA